MNSQTVEEFIREVDRKLPNKFLLTAGELAICDNLFNVRVLSRWRDRGLGPKFIVVGPRAIRYLRESVLVWVRNCFGKEQEKEIEKEVKAPIVDLPKVKVDAPKEQSSKLRVEATIGENTMLWLQDLISKMCPSGYGRHLKLPQIIRSLVLFLKRSGIDISKCKKEEEIISLLCSKMKTC